MHGWTMKQKKNVTDAESILTASMSMAPVTDALLNRKTKLVKHLSPFNPALQSTSF